MTWIAPQYSPAAPEPFVGAQRAMLDGFLNWHRASFLMRCSGLTGEQLAMRSVPPSSLSLLGLVRHLTDVELNYFRRRWGGQPIDSYYTDPEKPDRAFDDVDPNLAERDLGRLIAEQAAARQAVAHLPLDTIFVNPRFGEMSLQWALTHMIAEYSGHIGHADLIRERIDGKVGW